jgi:hypothetical protein
MRKNCTTNPSKRNLVRPRSAKPSRCLARRVGWIGAMPQAGCQVCRTRLVCFSDVALEVSGHFDDFGDVVFCYDDVGRS